MVSLSNNVRSVFFLSHSAVNLNVSALQSAGIFQVSKGTYTLPKKQNGPDHYFKKTFWARNFRLFNNYKGNFYIVPVVISFQVSKQQVSTSTVLEFFLGPTRWAPISCRRGETAPISRVFFYPSESQLFSAIYRGSFTNPIYNDRF